MNGGVTQNVYPPYPPSISLKLPLSDHPPKFSYPQLPQASPHLIHPKLCPLYFVDNYTFGLHPHSNIELGTKNTNKLQKNTASK